MDCNKDEAERAKKAAEEKMNAGDFLGAHVLATKAQRLYPDLENIAQMIAICDVQCSANEKIDGLDNWYGILGVQIRDDSDTIKKQYRKLTLLLHPDKNKFYGAEAAFKLVGEANRWLSDPEKRRQYDSTYRSRYEKIILASFEFFSTHVPTVYPPVEQWKQILTAFSAVEFDMNAGFTSLRDAELVIVEKQKELQFKDKYLEDIETLCKDIAELHEGNKRLISFMGKIEETKKAGLQSLEAYNQKCRELKQVLANTEPMLRERLDEIGLTQNRIADVTQRCGEVENNHSHIARQVRSLEENIQKLEEEDKKIKRECQEGKRDLEKMKRRINVERELGLRLATRVDEEVASFRRLC